MKTKFTIIAFICCLFYLPFKANAQWCGSGSGAGQTVDLFDWKAETTTVEGKKNVTVTLHPKGAAVGCDFAILNITEGGGGGHVMAVQPSGDLTFTYNDATGTNFKFHFTYRIGAGGPETNNSANKIDYTIGGNCVTNPSIPPTVSITSPLASDPFTSPATVNITATAADTDGTIQKVEFFSGANLLGTSTTSPYSYNWTNVQPGTYSITAKATDDSNTSTTSAPVVITVGGVSTETWCGSGRGVVPYNTEDLFDWKAETIGANVKVTLHPKGAAAGSNFAEMIVTEGGGGGFPMTLDPSGNLTYTYNNAVGTNFKFYFVYSVGNGGPHTNNSNNQISYTIGTTCAAPLPVNLIGFDSKLANNGTVNLTWATSSEQNNSYFLVERSADGKNFTTLQKIASKGSNSQTRLDYQYNDVKPLAGNNYYRLTQVDLNGDSKVVGHTTQNVSIVAQGVTLSPNPLTGNDLTININDSKATSTKVTISNVQGAIIFNQTVNVNNGVIKISLNSKPAVGLYLVKIADSYVQKLIIK